MATFMGCVHVVLVFLTFSVFCTDSRERDLNPRDYLKREHSLVKPYTGSGMNIPLWDFLGSTMVTNNYIRLTADRQTQNGAIWNKIPLYVRDWELHVHFKVHGKGRGTLFGDGFGIWYVKDRMEQGNVFGNKDHFKGLGIFIDTYSNHNGPHNHRHPYLSAQVNNGTWAYDHDRDGTHTEVAGCEALGLRNVDHDTTLAVRYSQDRLTVMLDIDAQTTLLLHDVLGHKFHFFLFHYSDNHDIISMKLYELEVSKAEKDGDVDYTQIDPQADFFAPPRDHVDDPSGAFKNVSLSWGKLILLIFCICLGALVCIIVGVVIFQKKQEQNRKRFY
uniref:Vesicular integral-membrane protein VIP36-like n=1 Tax=Saccoglossus kowalevskii TaxID=10224 RepID=A0ABM0MU89_SACKO|nr:PREDICTED: vesicular integral-membrane protein VIP36-like [Saccoglossus kowalevskii]